MPRSRPGNRSLTPAERVYRRLLILYPASFRQEYGELMCQLVRDQCKEPARGPRFPQQAAFWLRLLFDTAVSAGRERISQLEPSMNALLMKTVARRCKVTFAILFAVTFALLMTLLTVAMPKVYSSRARLMVDYRRSHFAEPDPYLLQTELAQIQSKAVLGEVIAELGLTDWLARQSGASSPLLPDEAYSSLRRMLTIRLNRNTTLLDVGVVHEDPIAAARIANKIVETYCKQARENRGLRDVALVDAAEPGMRPIRPNLPLSLSLGLAFSVLFAGFATAMMRRFVKTHPERMAVG